MLVKYIKDIPYDNGMLTLNQNYLVIAYMINKNKNIYWILDNTQEFKLLLDENIELLDSTHSKQWQVITSTRTNSISYIPYEWVKEIPLTHYDDRMDEIEGFWESLDDIYGAGCSHMSITNDCSYIEKMKDEFPDYDLRRYDELQTKLVGLDIDDGWVMCPECDEAFEVNKEDDVVSCPNQHCRVFIRNPYENC